MWQAIKLIHATTSGNVYKLAFIQRHLTLSTNKNPYKIMTCKKLFIFWQQPLLFVNKIKLFGLANNKCNSAKSIQLLTTDASRLQYHFQVVYGANNLHNWAWTQIRSLIKISERVNCHQTSEHTSFATIKYEYNLRINS